MQLDRFINRPVLSTVISVVIVILGVLGLVSLPITQYPDIAPPTIQVSTTYTGANAQTVLNSVIAPLEEQINGVENMDYMSSTATNTGNATIDITFKQGTDPDMAAVNVQNRVAKAQGLLPSEVTKVGVITQKRQSSMLIIFSVVDEEDKYTPDFIENYAKINIIPQVQRVKGVGDAMVMGADYSMRIWLKPEKMAEYKLMPSDITSVLAEQNVEAAPGAIGERENQTFQYTLRYRGRLSEEKDFENMVIRSNPDGTIIRVKDVAKVELGRSTYSFSGRVNGHRSVSCIVMQSAGSNATQVVQDIQALLEESRASLPDGLTIREAQNVNDFLFASIHEVIKTLIEAFILVFIVVFIFLQDMRSTIIPAIAIPVALVGTFFMLYLIGFSLNLLTLSAMVLAIAIVVDDAIVVVEGVHAKLDQGYTSARKASIDAMRELGGAIVSITLVMMAVFVPVSFMSGTAGTFYRQFGLTMAISIGFSALNALTLSPALCAILLKPHHKENEEEASLGERMSIAYKAAGQTMLQRYAEAIGRILHPGVTVLLIAFVALTVRVFSYNRIIRRKNRAAISTIKELLAYKEQLAFLLNRQSGGATPSGAPSTAAADHAATISAATSAAAAPCTTASACSSAATSPTDQDEKSHRLFLQLEQRILNERLFLKPRLTRDELSALLGVSKNRFALLFMQYSDKSFTRYINDMRLDYAASQLCNNPNYSVEAIAVDCGFPVRQTFYRLFSEKFGLTPAEYRRVNNAIEG